MLVTSACNKLEVEPKGFVDLGQFYKTEADAYKALTAIYVPLAHSSFYGRDWFFAFNILDDVTYYDRNYTNDDVFINNFNYTNTRLNNLWKNLYDGANRATIFLENIDKINFADEDLKEAYKGEVKFLRAYYYFILSSMWGDVPLRLTGFTSVDQEMSMPATPKEEVFDFIIREMEEAEAMVYPATNFSHMGRVTKTTVQGILARVYLKQAGYPINKGKPAYEKALHWALEVKSSNIHKLNTVYRNIFINLSQDKYDTDFRESMWEVEFSGDNRGSNQTAGFLGSYTGIYCNDNVTPTSPGWCYGYVSTTLKMEDVYVTNQTNGTTIDTARKNWNVPNYYYSYNATTKLTSKLERAANQLVYRNAGKFRREFIPSALNSANEATPINFPILRYADVLLMIAEADNEVNTGPTSIGLEAINDVRRRAMPTIPLIALGDMDYLAFQKFIRDERARELCYEGTRKLDLVRWGIYVYEMTTGRREMMDDARWHANKQFASYIINFTSAKHNLYPIPSLEMSTNTKIRQNPLW